jgi:ribosomal protein S14
MAVAVAEVRSELERVARALWLANAAHEHYGRCGTCGRTRDDDDRPLYVARQRFRRDFECLPCWEVRTA